MTLTEASSLDACTRSMMALSESMRSNMTYPGSDIRAMNTPPIVSAMGENNSTAAPTPTGQPIAQADIAPPNGPPSGWKPPANGKPPDGWKPSDGAAPPNGASPSGAQQGDQSSVTPSSSSSPSPTPGGNSGIGYGAPPSGSSSMPLSSQSMAIMGNSLYDYVDSIKPTIPSLFKS